MDHYLQENKQPCLLIPMLGEHLAYITCSLALVVASCGGDYRSTAHASSTDVAPMINAQIQALPPQGGTVDLRTLTGMQFIDSQIVVDHPVNLLLGAATFTCGAAISGPCIKLTRPSHIEMMRASTPSDHGLPVPEFGTRIMGAPGFTGFLISVEGIQNWNTAFGTTIEGGVLDGNAHSASGVHIQNQFGVHLQDLNIVNVNYGVQLENTNGLWTEGSWLDNVFIFDPATAGIDMRVSLGGSTSVANAYWNRVFINLFANGAVGLQTDAAALFANSRISFLKIWMSSGADGTACRGVAPVTLTGIRIRADMANTVFANTNVEALSCSGSKLIAVLSDPSVKQPVFEHLSVQGSPLPTVQ
jgi:hypothetical protein